MFCFGEDSLYDIRPSKPKSLFRKIQELVRNITSIPFPLISGCGLKRYSFGLLPYRRPVNVVIGKPIDVHKDEHPTQEQVNELFESYQKELENLFNEHKGRYLNDKTTVLHFK